ncbi:MAG TPA: 30S ribosomal protein S4 [Clostridiales bacterium]|nr:30S ribosomal protein S4 [Clostridiales bacterium]
MARYTDASCRLCRREGEKLFLKGERCYTGKCAVVRRAYAPGQHGQQRKKQTEYGIQLREKQKARRFYGVLEKQFEKYFEIADRKRGITGEILLSLLECRLDNVIYRLGLACSRPEARQLVSHQHVLVNGKRVNIPSYLVKVGDRISLSEGFRKSEKLKSIVEMVGGRVVPKWLTYDAENFIGQVVSYPSREDIDIQVKEHLIVELYSK